MGPVLLIPIVAVAYAGWKYWDSAPGPRISLSDYAAGIAKGEASLTDNSYPNFKPASKAERIENATIIRDMASDAGLSKGMQIAMIVNAYAESALTADAVGDGGMSVGLFQLHMNGGGKGLTKEERKNPRINTGRAIELVKANKKMMQAENAGMPAASLIGLFCTEIERPANKAEKAKERMKLINNKTIEGLLKSLGLWLN